MQGIQEVPDTKDIQRPKTDGIGTDPGIRKFATCSDGTVFHNINKTAKVRKLEKKQCRLGHPISRKHKMNKKGQSYCKTSNIRKEENIEFYNFMKLFITLYKFSVTVMVMTHGETKLILECAKNQIQFDNVMAETYCRTDSEKINYLQNLFGISLPETATKNRHEQYIELAEMIMKQKNSAAGT